MCTPAVSDQGFRAWSSDHQADPSIDSAAVNLKYLRFSFCIQREEKKVEIGRSTQLSISPSPLHIFAIDVLFYMMVSTCQSKLPSIVPSSVCPIFQPICHPKSPGRASQKQALEAVPSASPISATAIGKTSPARTGKLWMSGGSKQRACKYNLINLMQLYTYRYIYIYIARYNCNLLITVTCNKRKLETI